MSDLGLSSRPAGVEFRMPSLGADMDVGTLVEWLVKPGDRVARGQIVAVVETQKGAIDVEIFDEGEIVALLVQPVVEVPVGAVLAIYRRPGDALDEKQPERKPAPLTPVAPQPAASAQPIAAARGPIKAAPRARKLAEQLGVDLARVVGSGPDGSITGEDVEREVARKQTPAAGMRQAIAAAMSRSKHEIPHYYLWHTIDLEPAWNWLESSNRGRPIAARLLPIALLVRAVALALVDHPELSGYVRDGAFVPGTGNHVGLAVSLRDGGLVNPALHDADRGTLDELMARIADVSRRARCGGLRASELSEATITVTSLGDRGVDGVLPIIHPPQVAIVGFGSTRVRPWVLDARVVPRRLVEASLAADHRVSDGHAGGRFLAQIDRLLHTPEAL